MAEYILGITKADQKKIEKERPPFIGDMVKTYSNVQDAASACADCWARVSETTQTRAKIKFVKLYQNEFKKRTDTTVPDEVAADADNFMLD